MTDNNTRWLSPQQETKINSLINQGKTDEAFATLDHFYKFPNRLVGIGDLFNYQPEPALIDGYMPRKGLGQIYGPSYSGKSYAAVNLALSVCAGLPAWMGLPLNLDGPQHVVYVAAEGGLPFRDSVVGWLAAHPGADLSRLHVLDGGKGHLLQIQADESEVSESVRISRLFDEVNSIVGDEHVALIVLDPQINIMPSVDENSNREMAEVMGQLKAVADAAETLLLLVHHTGHTTGRARGASAQFGIMDLVIALEGKDGKGAMTFEKVKGAARPQDALSFEIASIGIDGGSRMGAYQTQSVNTAYLTDAQASKYTDDFRKRRVIKALEDGYGSATAISKETMIDRNKVASFLKELEASGEAVNEGSTTRPAFRLA